MSFLHRLQSFLFGAADGETEAALNPCFHHVLQKRACRKMRQSQNCKITSHTSLFGSVMRSNAQTNLTITQIAVSAMYPHYVT